MEPIVVEVTRGAVVEARHVVHAVAVRDGRVELAAGDPGLVTFLRSSAKPIQALPVVRARPGARRRAGRARLRLARRATRAARGRPPDARGRARAAEDDLECGAGPSAGRAQLLRQARRLPRALPGRGLADRGLSARPITRVSERCSSEVAAAAEVDPASIARRRGRLRRADVCLDAGACAHAFARLPSLEGGDRVVRAMRANPELLAGPVAADALLIRRAGRLGGEGRRRRALVRRVRGRPRRRAQGRGRRVPRDRAGAPTVLDRLGIESCGDRRRSGREKLTASRSGASGSPRREHLEQRRKIIEDRLSSPFPNAERRVYDAPPRRV